MILDVLRCFSVQILDSMLTQNLSQLADKKGNSLDRRFCVAPMMDWTTRDYRYFARLLTKHALLYTEMVTTGAILHGDQARFLDFDAAEHPLALQLGGSNPRELAECARIAQDWGYDEVNLNVGCPSDRVQNHMIGACLMGHPGIVADCIKAMQDVVDIPVTIKHRIGIDDQDSYGELCEFIATVEATGCRTFIVHARKAILSGLSPKENREIPPLRYEVVYQLKRDFPHLEILINGGIQSIESCQQHLAQVDGVMVGREAYQRPWLLHEVDRSLYLQEDCATPSREQVVDLLIPYMEARIRDGASFWHIARHVLGLYHGEPGGKQFRRLLSVEGPRPQATPALLRQAATLVQEARQRQADWDAGRPDAGQPPAAATGTL